VLGDPGELGEVQDQRLLGEILGDQMLAAALIDRLIHHAHIITLKGKSYRLKQRGTASTPATQIQP
jgi:DNA replication protein DnaC